ncbi:MAG: EAL domain-containing protein, partial [Chloroflexota bacterium]|nr:EAL domain-containing protein [Chloroflexota bacterium]
SPGRFIPIAEDAGLMDEIGRWIVQTAIAETRTWLSALNPAPPVSLNITRKQLVDPDFPADMADWADRAGLSAGRLRLEVPEGALAADVDSAIEAVARLRAAGFAVSVDDFGTGHSSLISLRRFAVDMLQLDHQFVTAIGASRDAATVTQAVIGLARGLDLIVLAEGVERREQADALLELGCTLGQGTWFSAPMPAAELLAYLLRNEAAMVQKSHDTGDPPNLRRLHGA